MNPSNGSSLSTSQTSSTLRPRTKRLISVEDDIYATDGSDSGPSRGTSRLGSRNASPGPHAHTGTTSSSRFSVTSAPSSSFQRSSSAQTPKSPSQALSGLLGNSWSAIQGIAATVMATDSPDSTRKRKPAHGRRTSTSAPPPKHWGPAGAGSHVGAGTQEEREAMVRALKRKDLLTASEHLVPDSVGRIKRRNSDERESASAPPGDDDDRDALVYIHHVRPQDTLAGLSIKYNCEQAVLRKANRMWPNDSIQIKKEVVLPVDACGVKGRPVQGPDELPTEDLLLGEYADSSSSNHVNTNTQGLPNGWNIPKKKDQETTTAASSDTEPPWKHDSWVLLPNDKKPTEIARMPRRALGFFPPARRKSLAYSDASTPRASVDVPRSSTSTNPLTSSPQSVRPRASSNLSSTSAHSRQRSTSGKAWALQGPGGVGTLGRNVRSPGPAQDGLNKKFAQYLPNVAPPPGQEYFTPWAPSLLDAGAGTPSQYGGSGAVTPLGGPSLDFQELGGAIEGWVRKVGTQAQKLLNEPGTPGQGKRSAVPVIGTVGGDLGDLIELQDDAFEISDEERNRGRSRAEETLASTERSTSRSAKQYQSARPDINLILRDRTRKSAGSKKD
ncbi:carbohydrate-binding module family 50 protein [Curvularia clavata]|uniref:Carbohydrate-binding module family 50 protein n=1 Tax=Curvularia clavata TaxID=95742 RepID=A0A9Q9DS81_CURCL|nr:carbohydrate-binding module family 50 protein [Curvularia clavata]